MILLTLQLFYRLSTLSQSPLVYQRNHPLRIKSTNNSLTDLKNIDKKYHLLFIVFLFSLGLAHRQCSITQLSFFI